jgi:two-component system OmpR family sensor kinase
MSIRLRLTIWYVGLLAIVLIGFGLLLYTTLANSLMGSIDRTIQTQGQQVVKLASRGALIQLVMGVPGGLPSPLDPFSSPGVFIQVSNAYGVPSTRSDNLQGRTIPLDQSMMAQASQGIAAIRTVQAGGTRLRVYTAPIIIDNQLAGYIQVAESLREFDVTLQELATLLTAGIVLTLALAALIGAFMARATLKPIDEITQTALRITRTEDLSRRIEDVRTQDEVGRLAGTFNEMLDRIEQLFRTQQRFIADISHELRTPLTTIRGNLDLLRRQLQHVLVPAGTIGVSPDDDLTASLNAIQGETDRMARLVNDLLLLAQADAGVTLERVPVELDTLLLDVYRQARVIADGVAVSLGHEDQAVVLGDADRLKQLLLNLVENAIKYTPKGGQVTLSLYREDSWVRLEVADTGIGIPPDDLPHIFERFYRVDKARSREKGGTGLGLSIAHWITQAHGGRISVESQVGEGTTFTIWLPER